MKKKTALIVTILAFSTVFLMPLVSVQGFSWNWWSTPEPEVEVEEEVTGKNPIVFVHGFMGGWHNWFVMTDKFEEAGWSEDLLYQIAYDDPIGGSNIDNADQLNAFIDDVLTETGAEKVDLITHSMGALSARYYIKYLGGIDKVDDAVFISGPNHGTYISYIPFATWLFKSVREMKPGSSLLNDLNEGDETPGDIDYTCIMIKTDEIVFPYSTSKLDGANNIVKNFGEHNLNLYCDDTFQWAMAAVA